MTSQPAISVVIPAYNAARYLRAAIASVLAQTFDDFECIVVDDGSTDKTADILEDLARADSRVRPRTMPHGGIVAALNAGIDAARSDLIARMDADDLCAPDRFEKQILFLRENPDCVAVGSRVLLVDPYGSPLWETDQKLAHDEIEAALLRGNGLAMCHPAVMMRKSSVLATGGYATQYQWVEDLDLFLRLAQKGRLANMPNILLRYRQHFGSVNKHKSQLQQQIKERLLAEAHRLRGRTDFSTSQIELAPQLLPIQQLQIWAGAALRQGNCGIARRHALAAIRHEPFSYNAWWLAYRCLRGRPWNQEPRRAAPAVSTIQCSPAK